MKYIIFASLMVIFAVICVLLSERGKTVYEVKLIISNNWGEYLLVYDQRSGRFSVPFREVAFDEIPTKVVDKFMKEVSAEGGWHFDYRFHFFEHKYDRVRDDTGPMYIFDISKFWGRKCVLCYALCMESIQNEYAVKKEYPFPEFYTLHEIQQMSEKIRPSVLEMKILKNHYRNAEMYYECTQKL